MIYHGMGVTSSPYPTDPSCRTYEVSCGTCGKHMIWTVSGEPTPTSIANALSDADWFPAGGYKDNDLDSGAQGAFWVCAECGPYAPKKTAIPAAFLAGEVE